MLVALDAATKSTIGLVAVFFVFFPLLVHAIVGVIAAQVIGERRENQDLAHGNVGESQG